MEGLRMHMHEVFRHLLLPLSKLLRAQVPPAVSFISFFKVLFTIFVVPVMISSLKLWFLFDFTKASFHSSVEWVSEDTVAARCLWSISNQRSLPFCQIERAVDFNSVMNGASNLAFTNLIFDGAHGEIGLVRTIDISVLLLDEFHDLLHSMALLLESNNDHQER